MAQSEDIAAVLRRRIESGRYGPGDRLPTVDALIAEFKTRSRGTVDRALRRLESEGLVTVRHGRGAFVREPVRMRLDEVDELRAEFGFALSGDPEGSIVGAVTGVPDVSVEIAYQWTDADRASADALAIERGTRLLIRTGVFRSAGEPYQLVRSYLRASVAAGLGLKDPSSEHVSRGTMALLQRAGIELGVADLSSDARMPRQDEARLLAIPPGTPVHLRTRILRTLAPDSVPVEMSVRVVRADLVGYRQRVLLGDRG